MGLEIEGAGSGSLKVGRIAEEEKQSEKTGGLVAVSLNWVKSNRVTKLSNLLGPQISLKVNQ